MPYNDPAVVSPDIYQVVLENDFVRVLQMDLPAGQSDSQHSHPAVTVIFIKGSKVEFTLPDGQVIELEATDGHVIWNDAWTHTVKNAGDTDIRAYLVETKR
ncbi:MAG: hypothetical protein IIC92_05880 [Chloroflexi bacterium]|nr:hypothetical protein [Chloroflexota bacterium]